MSAPAVAATAPSSMNGIWISEREEPTIRMIWVSLRLLSAERRMVVVMSRIAATSITAASAAAMMVATLRNRNSSEKISRWSRTTSTPDRPSVASATTWYCSGSVSLTRKLGCIWSGVSELQMPSESFATNFS